MHMGGPQNSAGATETAHVLTATLFQTLPLQQTDAQVPSAPGQQSSQVVTDVIQQLLELSEPGPVEASQPPQAAQQLSITVGINQDILQLQRIRATPATPRPRQLRARPQTLRAFQASQLTLQTQSKRKSRKAQRSWIKRRKRL